MREFTYRIADPNGMHARPAGRLATYVKQFESDVRVRLGEKEADAKRLLSLMSMGARCGSELHFFIEGADEEVACESLRNFCESSLCDGGKA